MKNRLIQVLAHILAWTLFLYMLTTLVPKPKDMNPVLSYLVPYLIFILYFYFNYMVLIPEYFIKRRYVRYILFSILCLVLTVALPSLLTGLGADKPDFDQMMPFEPGPPPGEPGGLMFPGGPAPPVWYDIFRPEFGYTVFVFLFLLTLSAGIRILIQWQQAEKEKVKTELALLKAQINPHFLFNTLNNIYSMSVGGSEKTSDTIETFSGILRFVLYDTVKDFVPLEKEIEYIRNYISLQKLRLPSYIPVSFKLSGDPALLEIAPMLLTPFIENAFKHGLSNEEPAEIVISVDIRDTEVCLKVRNRIYKREATDEVSGMGIGNTRRRLEMIYPSKHILDAGPKGDEFYVFLKIEL